MGFWLRQVYYPVFLGPWRTPKDIAQQQNKTNQPWGWFKWLVKTTQNSTLCKCLTEARDRGCSVKDSGSRLPSKEWDATQGLKSLSLRHKIQQRAQQCGIQVRGNSIKEWGIIPKAFELSVGGFLVIFIPNKVWSLGLVTFLNIFIWTYAVITMTKTVLSL